MNIVATCSRIQTRVAYGVLVVEVTVLLMYALVLVYARSNTYSLDCLLLM